MCGRFTLTPDLDALQMAFPWVPIPPEITPRYNIAPSQPVAVIPNEEPPRWDFFTWGLIPSWAKDPVIGSRMINARAETLAEKPSFRSAYLRRRCLIPADGFFEWQSVPGRKGKIPLYFRLKSGKPFAFAGLWELWHTPDGSEIRSCTIITTEPNEMIAQVHNRMPVILPPEAYPAWLATGEVKPDRLQPLLVPYPAEEMTSVEVTNAVNNPSLDAPVCVEPERDLGARGSSPQLI